MSKIATVYRSEHFLVLSDGKEYRYINRRNLNMFNVTLEQYWTIAYDAGEMNEMVNLHLALPNPDELNYGIEIDQDI